MKTLSCIVVDDELLAVKRLVKMISKINILKIIGTYTDPVNAFKQIVINCPEIVFLDIEMPKMNGFELKSRLEYLNINSQLIFVTGNLNHIRKLSAQKEIKYLLKPVDLDDLIKCLTVL